MVRSASSKPQPGATRVNALPVRAGKREAGVRTTNRFCMSGFPKCPLMLRQMDPYQKIKRGAKYPAVMLTHGINDPRVEPWFSAKMAARLQAATSSDKPVLLRIDYDAGHGIGSSRKQRNEEFADIFTFLFEEIRNSGGKKNDRENISKN